MTNSRRVPVAETITEAQEEEDENRGPGAGAEEGIGPFVRGRADWGRAEGGEGGAAFPEGRG